MSEPLDERLNEYQRERLWRLFAAHSEQLFGHLYIMTYGDSALAEDLVQEAFLAAVKDWSAFAELDDESQLKWLWTVARNKAVTAFRRNEVARKHAEKEKLLLRGSAAANDTFEQAITSTTLQRLWKAIGALPKRQRVICFLRYRVGMSCHEISEHLGCSEGNVTSQLTRASRWLMAQIADDRVCGIADMEGGRNHA